MSLAELLQTRQSEHEALLQRAIALLHADQRVVAAWLFGSRGRQTADALSDTDLWIVVSDADGAAVIAARRDFVAQVAPPLLVHEVLGNAPANGAYLMVLYPGQAGPHQVDWYWQPHAVASLPQQAVVLFERATIPRDTRRDQLDTPRTAQQQADLVRFLVDHFWVMSAIAAKAVARRFDPWDAASRIVAVRGFLTDVQRLVDRDAGEPGREAWRIRFHPPQTAREQIALLRAAADEMEALHPRIEAVVGHVPRQVIPYVNDFFDLAAMLIELEARPDTGLR